MRLTRCLTAPTRPVGLPGSTTNTLASKSLPVGAVPTSQVPFGKWVRMAERSKALRSGRSLLWRRGFKSHFWQTYPLAADSSCSLQPSGTLPLQGNLFANVFFFVNIKGSRKLAFPLTENLILNVSMTLTLRKPDKDTDTCCMNMRGMLLLHSFSVSPAWTLNFDCTVYQRMA